MWKWILRAAVAIAQSPWAKEKAHAVIQKLRERAEAKAKDVATAAGIDLPPTFKASRIIRTPADTLKPGDVVGVDGGKYRITRLLSSSARETVYEAEQV